jgi:lysophospholipase L1-like esterase
MHPVNEKVLRRKRRRRKLFLRRAAVFFCLVLLLTAAAEGTTAVIKHLSGSRAASARLSVSRGSAAASSKASAVSPKPKVSSAPGRALPAAVETPAGWFSDALFIGDSRTEGLRNYDGLPGATYYAVKGLMVSTVYTRQIIPENGVKKTVMQAQSEHAFGKIYVMLGVNELGWSSMQSFVTDYRKMVRNLKKDHPKAKIYLESLFPVSAKKSEESSVYKNEKIASYNQAIQKIAKQETAVYLDTAQAVSKDGVLPEDASVDGVHLNAAYCAKWCDYLKEHME